MSILFSYSFNALNFTHTLFFHDPVLVWFMCVSHQFLELYFQFMHRDVSVLSNFLVTFSTNFNGRLIIEMGSSQTKNVILLETL